MTDGTPAEAGKSQMAPDELIDSAEAGRQWWTGTWDLANQKAELTIFANDTLYDFTFSLQSPTSALVRFDISEHAGGLSPASSSPMHGWVSWFAGKFVLAMESEDYNLACSWEGSDPFVDDDVYDLDDQAAVAGFARLSAEIFFSPQLYRDDAARARYLGDEPNNR